MAPRCSVIVRTKDEAGSIGRTLDLLARQTAASAAGGVEVIVVDSGSMDGTVDIVRSRTEVRLIEIPAESFTFGGALNTGAAAAAAPILVALSAHAFPTDERWLERLVGTFDDPRVAAASGEHYDHDGSVMSGPRVQDMEVARANPFWGYSNAAGGFRAELWREHPFREDMPGCEDKEFTWHWLQRGRVVIIDPALTVDHDHSKDPLNEIYRRSRIQWQGYAMYLELPRYGLRELAGEWWNERGTWSSHTRARLSHRRATRLIAKYAALRPARAGRS